MPQYAVQFVAIEFVDIENELRPSGRSHDAFHLGCKLVILGQFEIIILDPKKLRVRVGEWNEKCNRIPSSNQYDAMYRQRRHAYVNVAVSIPAATPVKINGASGGDGQRHDCGDDPQTATFKEPDQDTDCDDACQHFKGYGVPVVTEAKRPAEVRQDCEYEDEIEAGCLRRCPSPTITVAHIAHRQRHESGCRHNIGNGGAPVPERRLRYDIGIDCCPIKWVCNELPEILRQESRVPNRLRFPVRRLKDLIEVGKCWVAKIVPKGKHVMPGDREKSQQGTHAKHDQAAKGLPPHRHKK